MPYSAVSSRRMAYDIDGTAVGYNYLVTSTPSINQYNNGITTWFDSTQKGNLNGHERATVLSVEYRIMACMWLFFPERREIDAMALLLNSTDGLTRTFYELQGSNDTANGVDGTWETATFPNGSPLYPVNGGDVGWWRTGIKTISFSEPKKVLRFRCFVEASSNDYGQIKSVHFYGKKYATEIPDDIIILDDEFAEDPQFVSVKDWGDRPEGTTVINSIRLQNASLTKTANNINLQLNHADFLISFNPAGPWGTVLDILSLAPEAVSSPIYIKNQLGPPLLTLGPKAARIIVTTGSWS